MPGFKISDEDGNGPNSKEETFRDHRFILDTFLGNPGNQPPFNLLKNVDLPERLIEELQIKTPGATYNFSKQLGFGNVKFIFYIPNGLIEKLEELFDKIGNSKTGIQNFNNYMSEIGLRMVHPDGDKAFLFKNAYISNITYGQLSYGSSEIKQATVTVRFSWYEVS
jgi:hypothetical protein